MALKLEAKPLTSNSIHKSAISFGGVAFNGDSALYRGTVDSGKELFA